MKLKGQLQRINNPLKFFASYDKKTGRASDGYVNWGKATLHLATDFPSGQFGLSFIPSMSFKTDANAAGEFKFEVPDGLKSARLQLLAFDVSTIPAPLPGMPPIPVLRPIYRSEIFKFTDVSADEQKETLPVYILKAETPVEHGISQKELDEMLIDARKDLGLDKLRATIQSSKVAVTAEKSGGVVKFSANLRGSTAADLNRVVEIKAGEMDIDLPGPDFITGLCVDEDQIESQIRKGLSGLSKRVSSELLEQLNKAAPGASTEASVSVWRTRHVKTGEKTIKMPAGIPSVTVPLYTVVPDGAFGLPRKLYRLS